MNKEILRRIYANSVEASILRDIGETRKAWVWEEEFAKEIVTESVKVLNNYSILYGTSMNLAAEILKNHFEVETDEPTTKV